MHLHECGEKYPFWGNNASIYSGLCVHIWDLYLPIWEFMHPIWELMHPIWELMPPNFRELRVLM